MKYKIFSTTLFLVSLYLISCDTETKNKKDQQKKNCFCESEYDLIVDSVTISGTLVMPDSVGTFPVVLIIAGSGPTDRNGNNSVGLKTNAYKMLADSLATHKIACVRFDKRGIAKSYYPQLKEIDLLFETYINDAEKWIAKLKADKRFSKIIVMGHSEGSLIGMISSYEVGSDAFISVSGPALSADSLLIIQLKSQPQKIVEESTKILKSLKAGKKIAVLNSDLMSLFRFSIQPYLISWFKYTPTEEIAKLKIPCLIIQGSHDIQVDYHNAELLKKANPSAELKIIDGMNHILKEAPADTLKNSLTYSNINLELSRNFCSEIITFVNNLK